MASPDPPHGIFIIHVENRRERRARSVLTLAVGVMFWWLVFNLRCREDSAAVPCIDPHQPEVDGSEVNGESLDR